MSKPFSVAVDQSWVDAGKEAAQREYSKVLSAAKTEGPDAARRASQRRLDSVLASSAALDATPVACKAGCTYCCHIRVVAQPAEVVGLVDYLRKMLSKERFAAFDARVRDAAERVKSMSRDEHIKSNLACPVLVDGRCAGYSARPMSCRLYHSTDVCHCERMFEHPDSDDDPNEIYVWPRRFVGEGHMLGSEDGLENAGYDAGGVELIAAMLEALDDPNAGGACRTERRFSGRRVATSMIQKQLPREWPHADDVEALVAAPGAAQPRAARLQPGLPAPLAVSSGRSGPWWAQPPQSPTKLLYCGMLARDKLSSGAMSRQAARHSWQPTAMPRPFGPFPLSSAKEAAEPATDVPVALKRYATGAHCQST